MARSTRDRIGGHDMNEEQLLERITITPGVRSGKPCVRGHRITVGDVLSWLAQDMTPDEILHDFPSLERDDIRAALAWAAFRERSTVIGLGEAGINTLPEPMDRNAPAAKALETADF